MTLAINSRIATRRARIQLDAPLAATIAVIVISAIVKFTFVMKAPLWLDEVWTGMIASQRTFPGFIHQCYLDINAPLDYLVTWVWSLVAGLSNEALRFPSRLFASTAPLLAVIPSRSIDRTTRLVWCALLACWLPGLIFAIEARCYPLVLMLATASAAAFAHLIVRPSSGAAWAWASLSSLLILAHYVSITLVACQGVAFLAVHRAKAVASWPAAFAFAPALASLALHASLILSLKRPPGIGPLPIGLRQAGDAAVFVMGGQAELCIGLLWASASLLFCWLIQRASAGKARIDVTQAAMPIERSDIAPYDGHARLWIVPAASMAALMLCFAISMTSKYQLVVVDRYLTAITPGLLMGVAMIASHFGRTWPLSPAILVGLYFGIVVGQFLGAPKRTGFSSYEFETASDALMTIDTRRLVFMLDSPAAVGGDPDAFGRVGGFFFKRAARPTPVTWVAPVPGHDPNDDLLAQATRPGTAILWLYDPTIPGARTARFPPRLDKIDHRWGCRDFGAREQHVLACSQNWGPGRLPISSSQHHQWRRS